MISKVDKKYIDLVLFYKDIIVRAVPNPKPPPPHPSR